MGAVRNIIVRIGADLSDMQSSLKTAQTKISEFGEKVGKVGEKLSVGLTAPIVAVGAVSVLMASDVQDSANKIQASLGATAEDAKKLTEVAKSVWKDGFGENVKEASDAIIQVKQQMTNLNDTDLKNVTESAMTIKDLFGSEVNESVAAASVMMKNFGISGQEAMDIITTGYQKGGDYSGELLDTLREYSPQFKTMGFSAKEMLGILIEGTKAGAFNLDKVGDAMKEFSIRAIDGSKTTIQGFQDLGFNADTMAKKIGAGGDTAKSAFVGIVSSLASIKDPIKQNTIGVSLFGTQWEDLKFKVINAMAKGVNSIQSVEGATKKAGDSLYNNLGSKLESMKRNMQEALLPFGEKLLELANEAIPKVQAALQPLIDTLNNMSPDQIGLAIAIAGVVAIIGPALIIIGQIISAIGAIGGAVSAIVGVISGAGAAIAGVFSTIGAVIAAVGWPITLVVVGIVALVAAGVLLYKNWDAVKEKLTGFIKALPGLSDAFKIAGTAFNAFTGLFKPAIKEQQLFSDKTSEATKKAINSYMELDNKASKSLMSLKLNAGTVTKETSDNIIKTFGDMGDRIKTSLDKDFTESSKSLTDIFNKSSALTQAEKDKTLATLAEKNNRQKEMVDSAEKQITGIMTKAANEKRALTEKEQSDIAIIQNRMKVTAVKTLSDGEIESRAILERMKQQAGNLTAEQAAAIAKNAIDAKNKSIKAANDTYDGTVKAIIKQRDEAGSISAAQADKMIKEAKRAKDESVKSADELSDKVVIAAKKQSAGQAKEIDWTTGKVKSGWDRMLEETGVIMGQIGTTIAKAWESVKKVTGSSWDIMAKSVSKAFDIMKSGVEPVVSVIRSAFGKALLYLSELPAQMSALGRKIMSGLSDGISSARNKAIDVINGVIGSLNNIKLTLPGWLGGQTFAVNIPKIPKLETGTNYVPQDMLAVLHKGEAVIPKQYNNSQHKTNSIVVNVTGNTIASDYDVNKIANQMIKKFKIAGVF